MSAHRKNAAVEQSGAGRTSSGYSLNALVLMVVLTAWALLLYAETLASMAGVWMGSRTYTHGFLILPMSAFIIWQKRGELRSRKLRPSAWGFAFLIASMLVWYLSRQANIQLGEQLGLVAILGTAFWSVVGTQAVRVIRFPLLFAFFAVPFGDFLIPPLMAWTAEFAVWALTLTGIPVYLEGYYFSLPSGNFEVVKACSGIRFLIVTVVLATFFAYEQFADWKKRSAFVAIAGLTMIVANGVRAYLIVLIAHMSDMKYGTGQDHIYFGWFVFALVIAVMFWIGAALADKPEQDSAATAAGSAGSPTVATSSRGRHALWTILIMLAIGLGPVLDRADGLRAEASWPRATLPIGAAGWHGPTPQHLPFVPAIEGGQARLAGAYAGEDGSVDVHLIYFTEQRQGEELIHQDNTVFDAKLWRLLRRMDTEAVTAGDESLNVNRAVLTNGDQKILLWFWYDIGGTRTASTIMAKIYHALHALVGRSEGEAMIVLATRSAMSTARQTQDAASRLASFVVENHSNVTDCIRVRSELPEHCSPHGVEP